jgi:hypothetical protein
MAATPTKSQLRIETNRKWEDYKTLKAYWSPRKVIREILYTGSQTATNASAEIVQIGGTVAFLGANDIVYAKSEADLAALDGDSIYIDYASSTGTLYEGIETKLDSGTSTATEVPIGCLSGSYVDTVAAVNGDVLTMTGLNSSVVDEFAGWYVVACGDATDQEGAYLTILSSSAASPTLLTCTTTPNANWAADNVSVQKTLNNDVYRIRRMWTETESPTDNNQYICDKDETNIYAIVPDGSTFGGSGSRYFALSSSYTCYLGRVEAWAPHGFHADNESLCHQITITYTPVKATGTTTASDITQAIEFNDHFLWEPCIELEPCTDVIFKMHKILNSEDFIEVTLDYSILEVTE